MPLNKDIKKVLMIGSGPIVIGQAAEFDYAGAQACRVLRDEGIEVVGHMGYAAFKLWNVANYEKRNYKELGMSQYPNWYDQKKRLKE